MSGRRSAHYSNKRPDHELTVFTRCQELITYSFVLTEKFPKKTRFTVVQRIQNLCMDLYESLVFANETFVDFKSIQKMKYTIAQLEQKRKEDQQKGIPDKQSYYFRENKIFHLKIEISNKFDSRINERRGWQNKALAQIKNLLYFIRISVENHYVSLKQYEHWAKLITEVKAMTGAWIASDKKRFDY